jgi:flagellar biosynthesis protein FlhG
MEKGTKTWSIEHKEHRIGPMSSYALALWGLQGLLYPNDVITGLFDKKIFAGYMEGMQPFIRNNGHLRRARLWAMAGGKGGVGKSLVTAMTGLSLARMPKKVVIVDADFAGADLRRLFSLRYPSPNLWRLLDEKKGLTPAALPTSFQNISLITAPETAHDASLTHILRRIQFICALRNLNADYVLLDFGSRTDIHELDHYLTADLNAIVSSAEPTSLENTAKFIKQIFKRKIDVVMHSLSPNTVDELAMDDISTPLLQQAFELFRALDLPADEMLTRITGSFNIQVIFNQVEDDRYRKDFVLLKKYLKHEVGITVNLAGGIRFEPLVQQATRKSDLRLLTQYANNAFRDATQVTTTLLSAKSKYGDSSSFQPVTAAHFQDKGLLCGVWCNAWGDCNYQKPGKVCPVRILN